MSVMFNSVFFCLFIVSLLKSQPFSYEWILAKQTKTLCHHFIANSEIFVVILLSEIENQVFFLAGEVK